MSIKNVSQDKTHGNSRLEFNITGPEINYVIVNTLRRMVLSDVPIYAFSEFTFTKNNSIFHNNFIKNQIKNMPVWGIDNKIEYYEKVKVNKAEKAVEIEDLEDNVELSVDKKVDSTSLDQLTMYVDYENKSNDNYVVTTNDAKFYFAQKQIENPYKNNIQIVKLQPKQYISFNVVTSIGIEKENTIYSPVSICVYEQKSDNDFRFIIESKGQLTEKRILKVAILNLLKKLQDISDQVAETSTSKEESGEIQINKEDHTFGNLLTHGLQNHKNISFAGYNMPHPLEKRVVISYKLKSGNFVDIFKSLVKDFIELFTKIDKVLDKTI